jgi:hypothetical protein
MGQSAATCIFGFCGTNVAPIAAGGGYAADLNMSSSRYIVRNNSFSHNRARGFLAQAAHGLVQNNSFTGQSLFSLYVVTSSYWGEGPGAQNVLFLNNAFSSTGVGGGLAAVTLATEDSQGVIYDPTPAVAGRPDRPGTEQNLIFAGNTFSSLPGGAFYISSANNVILYKNAFTGTNQYISHAVPNINAVVSVYDASNILLSGNTSNSAVSLTASNDTDGAITIK